MNEVTPIADDQEMLRAYVETIKLKDAEIEQLRLELKYERLLKALPAHQPFGDLRQIAERDAEIGRLKALLTRAADALAFEMMARHSQIEIRDHSELIAQLRKAAG
jgi:hypothetical protein